MFRARVRRTVEYEGEIEARDEHEARAAAPDALMEAAPGFVIVLETEVEEINKCA